jgi:hypothetical protein
MVRFDDSLVLALFHEIAARTAIPIMVGNEDTLFEMNYVHAGSGVYTDPPPPSRLSLDASADLLARLARALKAHGIDLVVVLYPHKVWMEPDLLPARWSIPGGREVAAAGYARLLASLRAHGVPVIDGVALLTDLHARDPKLPLYNRGGTHWTEAAACSVAQALVATLLPDNPLRCPLGALRRAEGVDMDLANLINIWNPSRFADLIPDVKPVLTKPTAAQPIVYIGSSFGGRLIQILTDAHAIRDVTRAIYFRRAQADKFDWSRVLKARLVVLEQSQGPLVTANLTEFAEELFRRVPELKDPNAPPR